MLKFQCCVLDLGLRFHNFFVSFLHMLNYIIYGLQVSLKLDIAQDKIMLANTRLSVAVVMIGLAAYFTGTYVCSCALHLKFFKFLFHTSFSVCHFTCLTSCACVI